MELRQYFSILVKWLWMIVLSTVIAAGLSYFATKQQPRMYQATTKLLVGQALQTSNPNSQDIQTSERLALTYIQIAETTPVLQATIKALGLNMSPAALRESVNAGLVVGTQLIELRVDDSDPERAQALVNELARQMALQGPVATQDAQQRKFIQAQVDELQRKIADGQTNVAELQKSIDLTLGARELAAKQQQIATLNNQISQWQQNYATLLVTLAPRSSNYISVIEPADLPTTPFSPKVALNVGLAAVIGALIALGAAVLLEYMDDSMKQPADVMRTLGLPTLSLLANVRHSGDALLVTATAPRSAHAEAYRVLRTNIQFHEVDRPIKAVLVTSANQGDGKSTAAANLAIAMAQAGLRTILVDGDLRKPYQHRMFNFANDVGLTHVLLGKAPIQEALHPTGFDLLKVLPSGALPPNPAELLGSERMRSLVAQLEAENDMLIVDAPPCLPVTDAAVLARLVGGVLLVIDATHTRRREAQHAKEFLEGVGARFLGVVLNRVPSGNGNDYYYRSYSADKQSAQRTVAPRKGSPGLFHRITTRAPR